MCGVAGIVSFDRLDLNELQKMTKIIHHRGPDDVGFTAFNTEGLKCYGDKETPETVMQAKLRYTPEMLINEETSHDFNIGLGHKRLSILDLSESGHQPMCGTTDNYWITFNGEVYNFKEIRNELIEKGYKFTTKADTEVIIKSFEEWGSDCVHKFVGMFAFAILDRAKNELNIFRDRYGIKPLYYWVSPSNNFYFASEIKQFTVLEEWKAILNHQRAYDYLMYSFTDHTEETMFKGVYQVLPGHSLVLNLGNKTWLPGENLKTNKWYNPKRKLYTGTYKDAVETFLNKLKDSINLHMVSDVKVGAALSGGLDSSSIVCIIDQITREHLKNGRLNTFSAVSKYERFSEKKWVDEVRDHTKVNSHFIYSEVDKVFSGLENLIWHMDEPYQSQSAYVANLVHERVKATNITVLLNGQGADEYLSGYGSFDYIRQYDLLKKGKLLKLRREYEGGAVSFCFHLIKLVFLKNLSQSKIEKVQNILGLKKLNPVKNLLNFNKLMIDKKHPLDAIRKTNTGHIEESTAQLVRNPLPKYLRWEDRNSMSHSIESRVPFLDHRLVEFTQNLPINFLNEPRKNKKMLVDAMINILPESVRNRKDKMGFITPEEQWLKGEGFDQFEQLLQDSIKFSNGILKDTSLDYLKRVKNDQEPFNYSYWRLIQFGIWMKVFKVNLD
jgi:asparagine synthase (glutamine-hydrolysing)